MTEGSREKVRDFNAKLVERFYQGESVNEIAVSTGRSISTIHKLIKDDETANGPRERLKKPSDPRIMVDKKMISKRHGWIGIRIARYRAEHDLTPTAFGMRISVSRVVVRNMEVGAHDFTLTQLERLSDTLKVSFDELTTPLQPRKVTA